MIPSPPQLGHSGITDVSEPETRARRLLEESQQRFRSLFEYHPHAVYSFDLQGNFVGANAACEAVSGYAPDELLHMSFPPLVVPDDLDRTIHHFELAAQGTPQNYEIEIFHKSGRRIPIHVTNVPIVVDGIVVGVYGIAEDISDRRQAAAERERGRRIAEERSAELHQVYQREHQIAEALQRSLLNRPARLFHEALEVETVYRAALEEAEVGGDFFDAVSLTGGKVALIVGDVSGKGLNAAGHTAEIKFTMRAYLRDNPNVAAAMDRLNALLCTSQSELPESPNYFVCLSVVVVDTAKRTIDVGTAGCDPPILLRGNGKSLIESVPSMPLGVDPGTRYCATRLPLNENDLLILATDGVTEIRHGGSGEFLGTAGLIDLALRSVKMESLEAISQAIVNGAETFAAGRMHDDVCLLVARLRTGTPHDGQRDPTSSLFAIAR